MAQDVFSKMADDPCLLKEDGYLNAATDLRKIVYHPSLNVIIVCSESGKVHIIDVNSGVVLHTSNLSAKNLNNVTCRYVPGQDRVLFCDGQALGVRSDYNGVLLLDTILQKPVGSSKDDIKLELLLSEAQILKKSLSVFGTSSIDYVVNELTDQISKAQKKAKKGIKAQKWNTVCLELPLGILRDAASTSVTELLLKNQHVPELGVASAVQERLADLMGAQSNVTTDRRAMASEAIRRETFTHWPHMDYKWALPDQMAQAGFYHQPNSSGDDRAMCFTCSVCLVCWERTDEPWSEHERHSPTCPFVMGEYTQNVPLSVTYATNPAFDACFRGIPVSVIGTSRLSHLLPTANREALISILDVSGKVHRVYSFFVNLYDSYIIDYFTKDFELPLLYAEYPEEVKGSMKRKVTAVTIVSDQSAKCNTSALKPAVIGALKVECSGAHLRKSTPIEALNKQNKSNSSINIMDVEEELESNKTISSLYLIVYDFTHTKKENTYEKLYDQNIDNEDVNKSYIFPFGVGLKLEETNDVGIFVNKEPNNYQNLIPGESDEIFLPQTITQKHSGPRVLPIEMQTETDAAQATSILVSPDYSIMTNGPLNVSNIVEKTISDHIIDVANNKELQQLNYPRCVQCVCIPDEYKRRTDLEVTDMFTTQDDLHILVILTSTTNTLTNVLLLYALDFYDNIVKLTKKPVLVRELSPNEKPIEVSLLNQLERPGETPETTIEGTVILVCVDGVVRIIELCTLRTIYVAQLENESIISAAYCNSIERLCASTAKGALHFYALNDADTDSTEDHDEEDLFSSNIDFPSLHSQQPEPIEMDELTRCFHEPAEVIGIVELKRLQSLCYFEPFKPGFCAVVPPCWSDMQQGQRQRRHPQHLQLDNDQYTKTWRLQNDTTTWDEHIFEITLPSPVSIGHVDVYFSLQPGTVNPSIEVTLLRQNTSGIGHRRDVRFAVDEVVSFDALRNNENPVTSQEYLRSHNADILAGPIDLASCLDLSEQSGCVTLTSPKLFKSRNRTLLLHIKAVTNIARDEKASKSRTAKSKREEKMSNRKEYMGCDCIHELSVTVFSSKHTEIAHERSQRSSMLESNVFIQSLVQTTTGKCEESRLIALDILNWIASIRLTRNRSQHTESPTYQYEILRIIEGCLDLLLKQCVLLVDRSIAHKCVKLIVTCSHGARNINSVICDRFDKYVFDAILNILNSVQQIKSAGSLQWLVVLIFKIAPQDQCDVLSRKCISLLTDIADEFKKRSNPYHLLLRSRFGLYGTPLEPDLFDMDPPITAKSSNSSITYTSVVTGETIVTPNDCQTSYVHNKEYLDPKDVLTTTGDMKIKLKNLSPTKMFRGLLETESLHFSCLFASDGTRLERADAGTSSVPTIVPVTLTNVQNSGTKKLEFIEFEHNLTTHKENEPLVSNGQIPVLDHSIYEMYVGPLTNKNKIEEFDKMLLDTYVMLNEDVMPSSSTSTKTKRVEEILSPNKSLPLQQLLVPPPAQVIVVERMHSGARRFVVLDFGQPTLLTDVMIPAYHDLVSISIDLWLKNEETDVLRLVVSSDIGSRDLVLTDLQPPPLFRYMKITAVGRYGMSTTRCRIPIGNFYGHIIVLPKEIPSDIPDDVSVLNQGDLEGHMNVLTMLFEDVSCRYSLACSKLKDLLHPLLMSDSSNASHLSAYMETIRDKTNNAGNADNTKIFTVYQEAITYQRQINVVRSVITRVEAAMNSSVFVPKVNSLADASMDKLRLISEGLLEILLSMENLTEIDQETCVKIFEGYCVSQRSRVQILSATLLDRTCRKQPFWGNFLADTLSKMFSSSYSENFPQDRVFVLLAYLVRRSMDRSLVLDATMRVISQALLPLANDRRSLLAVTIDLPLLGWLLLFLSLQLDLCKGTSQNATRWDWVTGEMAGKSSNESLSSSCRKKLHKRFIQYKQQLGNLDFTHKEFTHKVVQTPVQVQALTALSNHAANLTSKLEAALKHQENFFKKIKQYKLKDTKNEADVSSPSSSSSKHLGKRRRESADVNGKQSPQNLPQKIDTMHCLAVAKGLLTLLLAMDHSCSADMFLLSCKVIARLVRMSGMSLGNLMTEEQLNKLIHLCIGSELPWAPHALACLLHDIVDIAYFLPTDTEMETDVTTPSTSFSGDILADVENLCEAFEIEDQIMADQLKTTKPSNNNSGPLPSVFESDDSEFEDFLDDILERGRSLLKKPPKTNQGESYAMDSRLEATVELQAEVILRRLISMSSYSLVQNINTPVIAAESEMDLMAWPEELLLSWQIQTEPIRNRNMLINCFDNLFKSLPLQSSTNIEHILQLWLTLSLRNDEKFNPNSIPFISLSPEAVNSLITAITWSPGLSLRTWCSALQSLTLICNIMHGSNGSNTEWSDTYGLYCRTGYVLNHPDFVQMFLRLLSGSGLVFSDKGLAGPSLCKSLHDFVVRLHMRCDVVSPSSMAGSLLKSLLLKIVYQLVQPSGPLSAKQGPLDAQCKLLQTMIYLDYSNADLSIAISILESTGFLVYSYVSNSDHVKCVNIGERLSPTCPTFGGLFASVLGTEPNKQDKPVSWDILLISLLKLLGKLVQTPLPNSGGLLVEAMETETMSQTDESKAEQIQQEMRQSPLVPCLADTVLQHHPSIIQLCKALASCKASTLSMLANMSQQNALPDIGEPSSVGDAVFSLLTGLARKASQKIYVMEPLLLFLSNAPQLSEPLLWFILQVLDTEESLRCFDSVGGIQILAGSLVSSSNAPNTVSHASTVSMVMQHFVGFSARSDASTAIAASSATKKIQQACLENNLSLVNFAPYGSIRCQNGSAHPADVLIQGGTATHRRARTPQWSYHFYPDEAHTELTLQLPSAVLLREVHLQPHLSALATCPSAVALEVSADGPSRLVPACPPLPTSGMTFIRLHLPVPEVVNCIQLRLYKPRDANNIGLSQIRLLGTSAFGGNIKQQVMDLSEDESHCRYSLGWLRLLHHCFILSHDKQFQNQIIQHATEVPNLLNACCGLLLVPTHIPTLYLPNLEKVLCDLSLFSRENGLNTIKNLLDSRVNVNEPTNIVINLSGSKIFMNSAGSQSACELLYQVCGYQDQDTSYRVALVLNWLQDMALQAVRQNNLYTCSPAYISSIASIIWNANLTNVNYNLSEMITLQLFDAIYEFNKLSVKNIPLKCALDSLLCSLCYIKSEFFPLLLQKMGVLIPNLSTDRAASISDDRKDSERMTDDSKESFECNSEWYGHLIISELPYLNLSNDQLETIALVSRSPTSVQQLLDSGLPKLLNSAVLQFCSLKQENTSLMAKLEKVTVILKFFADVSEEKLMRDWLGSSEGSSFWLPLLQFLCKKPTNKRSVHSESFAQLEEVCVRFLSKCCLCHPNNQTLLAKVLCEVIGQQTNGITGFMRRLILQLLLENEKVPVSIKANETLFKHTGTLQPYLPIHPAFKQTHDRALLYLGTNILIGDILDQYISFSSTFKAETPKKENSNSSNRLVDPLKNWFSMAIDSEVSMAAGVTAKDKRVKDAKNQVTATPLFKKKRYTSAEGSSGSIDNYEGRIVKCDALPDQVLPVNLTLAQLLTMIEDNGITTDWPCIHLTVYPSKGTDEENQKIRANLSNLKPLSSALQVFSMMGGLALLALHLPTVYPETIRPASSNEKQSSETSDFDWVKVDGSDDIYEDLDVVCSTPKPKPTSSMLNVPPHSLTAFGLFLRLPSYAEVLLKDMKKALCLLRLVLGVTDDGEGADIFQTPIADSLPTLPFEVLKKLYEATPLTTDDGRLLRRISINIGVVHLLLACLGIFTHQTQGNMQKEGGSKSKDDRSQSYWAKGTGFGTGSTQQSWNVEQALLKQRSEEEHVTVLLQVLSSYINPGGDNGDELATGNVLPQQFPQLLANSALLPALSSYLRNDSVLDMARHIPLYCAALELLRAMAISCQLVHLLLPQKSGNGPSISSLLKNMKTCVDTYASKLRFNGKPSSAKSKFKANEQIEEMERDEGLAKLMPDIQLTANLVCDVTARLAVADPDGNKDLYPEKPLSESPEDRYLRIIKTLQFDTYEMIQELPEGGYKFVISHHFENNARSAGDQSSPARVKRLAQETVTLVTSLPLSCSSSVFVRCDTDRLDIMKVLITGPAETPYANGCFELDVFFPPDYPQAPMMINLETTGHHTVRFNPNLYNDGKVCLSVLNTWHGRPEEKWNPQTSSFLQVLVSIQSLILVPEPYFNEPGYERSRGTPSGTQSSKEYNANVCQATVRWAMLEQIVNPCPCFKDIINTHFYLKREEIMEQVENWIKDLETDISEKRTSRSTNKRSSFSSIENFKKVYQQLKEKLLKLTPPASIASGNNTAANTTMEVEKNVNGCTTNEHQDIDNDIDMEKMVNDMCE
nr:baculoviral IAP repeat-containing protein 6 isoform X2 [Onthophagus taurus]